MISAGMAPNASAIPIPLQIADDFALTVLVHLPGLALGGGGHLDCLRHAFNWALLDRIRHAMRKRCVVVIDGLDSTGRGTGGIGPGIGIFHPRPSSFIVGNSGQRASSARRLRRDHVFRTPRVVLIQLIGDQPISPLTYMDIRYGTKKATSFPLICC